jgi:hypothetical protein
MSKKEEQFTGQLAVIGIFGVIPIALALMLATAKLGPASIPIWMAAAAATWLVLKGPVGKALGARISGEAGAAELQGETLAELDELRARVAELEERQDFSERLLAQSNAAPRLDRPGA